MLPDELEVYQKIVRETFKDTSKKMPYLEYSPIDVRKKTKAFTVHSFYHYDIGALVTSVAMMQLT